MSDFKTTLLDLGCPLVNSAEEESEVRKLLLDKSVHRTELLEWVVSAIETILEGELDRMEDKLGETTARLESITEGNEEAGGEEVLAGSGVEEVGRGERSAGSSPPRCSLVKGPGRSASVSGSPGPGKRPMEKRLKTLCIPKAREFVLCTFDSDSVHLNMWKLLLGTLSDLSEDENPEEDEDSLELEKELEEMSRNPAFGANWVPEINLVPRDLEAEIRSEARKVTAAPTKEKMEEILRLLQEKVDQGRASEMELDSGDDDDRANFPTEKLQELLAAMKQFEAQYDNCYKPWVEKIQGLLESGGEEVPRVEFAATVTETLEMVKARFEALQEIRGSVLEVDELKKKVMALFE